MRNYLQNQACNYCFVSDWVYVRGKSKWAKGVVY